MLFLFLILPILNARSQECNTPLLVQDNIANDYFSPSSEKPNHEGFKVRLNSNSSWCHRNFDSQTYIQIFLGGPRKISKLFIKNTFGIVKQFNIEYYVGNKSKVHSLNPFRGSQVEKGDETVTFFPPFIADALKIRVFDSGIGIIFRNYFCMQLEVYGCEVTLPTTEPPTTTPRIDYCANNTCDQRCFSGLDRYICTCYSGYERNHAAEKCQDINECKTGADRCDVGTTDCINTLGSYKCKCNHDGLKLDFAGKKCVDKNECLTRNGGCNQRCKNKYKSYECECWDGFLLGKDNHTCYDVDECADPSTNACDTNTTTCENSPGKYQCKCLSGMKHTDRLKATCEDIDECADRNGGCEQNCTNDYRSYKCSCKNGFLLGSDGKSCVDVNECRGPHDCQQVCRNLIGSYYCDCKRGYQLNTDGKTCSDVNECSKNNGRGPCEETCANTDGSYVCSCGDGLELASDGTSCQDYDECAHRTDTCDHATSTCVNFRGSFMCRCKQGFVDVGGNKCAARKCPAIDPLENGFISPPDCISVNAKQFKDVCTYHCNDGFEPRENSADKVHCDYDGRWKLLGGNAMQCRRKRCTPIPQVTNGYILPPSCGTLGPQYNESCNLYCNTGHFIKGNDKVTCQIDQTYDGTFDNTRCLKKKKIVCPRDVYLDLPKGASRMTLPLAALSTSININEVETKPAGVLTQQFEFEPKSYSVELFYKNPIYRSKDNSCRFYVKVTDREPPTIKSCPGKDYYITLNAEYGIVSWPEPVFQDNVGITKFYQNVKNNQTSTEQVLYVFYTAVDEAGNVATCRFFVHVKARYCSKAALIGGDQASKTWFPGSPGGLNVYLLCAYDDGLAFSTNVTGGGIFRCNNGSWGTQEIPDCVSYIKKNGSCPVGTRVVSHVFRRELICADCPKGTMGTSDGCTPCKENYFQDESGATVCKPCPFNTVSNTGARSQKECQAQCPPGSYSLNGLYGSKGCKECPQGSYQDEFGQQSCKLCPNGDSIKGAKSENDCTFGPRIISILPKDSIEAKVGDTITVDCIVEGNPQPHISIQSNTTLPPASFRGQRSFRPIFPQKKFQSGLRMTITNVKTYDSALYRCEANIRGNLGGHDQQEIYLKVTY